MKYGHFKSRLDEFHGRPFLQWPLHLKIEKLQWSPEQLVSEPRPHVTINKLKPFFDKLDVAVKKIPDKERKKFEKENKEFLNEMMYGVKNPFWYNIGNSILNSIGTIH